MQDKQRYIVHTRWGVFSLSEECYQDYLEGKLWISWDPDKERKVKKEVAINVSQEAVHLRDSANKQGIIEILKKSGLILIPITPYKTKMSEVSIQELPLKTRASNGLMRSGIFTLGKLEKKISSEEGLKSIRNLGEKSIAEIQESFIEGCYEQLNNNERAAYLQELLDQRSA